MNEMNSGPRSLYIKSIRSICALRVVEGVDYLWTSKSSGRLNTFRSVTWLPSAVITTQSFSTDRQTKFVNAGNRSMHANKANRVNKLISLCAHANPNQSDDFVAEI